MTTTIYILILFFLFILYYLMSHLSHLKTKPKLDEVEAGPTGSVVMGQSRSYNVNPLRPQDRLFVNGEQNKHFINYKQLLVKGTCMEALNIFDGDVILVELFKENISNIEKLGKIEKHDILLIYLNDKKFKGHKIRVFSGDKNEDSLNTFYYNPDGSIHDSNSPHRFEDIKGIVKMKLD